MHMLGRVARGVGGAVFGGDKQAQGGASNASFEADLESLLYRISDGLQADYRREAMAQLKDLLASNPRAQQEFGDMGLPIMVGVLQEDRDDEALLHGALEVLLLAMPAGDVPAAATAGSDGGVSRPAAAMPPAGGGAPVDFGSVNAELFCRKPDSVALLLTLLEEPADGSAADFYTRYFTMQLLTALGTHCPRNLQVTAARGSCTGCGLRTRSSPENGTRRLRDFLNRFIETAAKPATATVAI